MATTPEFDDYLRLVWSSRSQGAFEAQKQLVNWLFAFNGAGIAGTLGYANSRGVQFPVVVALVAFVIGVVAILVWGTLVYYFSAQSFRDLKADTERIESDKITMQAFIESESKRSGRSRLREVMAWISGLSGLTDLISLILAVVLS